MGRHDVIVFRAETGVSPALSDWLDLARGLAAVEVLAFHSYQLMFMEKLPGENYDPAIRLVYSVLWTLSAHGPAAVLVFFVLSGYLVGGPALVRNMRGRLHAVDYFSARVSRLYVVLLPALTVSFSAYVSARQSGAWQAYVSSHLDVYNSAAIFQAPIGAATAICNGLFLQTIACSEFAGNAALWSLSNEFWYYVLFFAIISARKIPAYILLIIAVLALFVMAEHFESRGTHAGLKLLFFFAIWSLGVIAYAVVVPIWVWCCSFVVSTVGLYVLASKGLVPQWAAFSLAVGLGTTAFIVGIDYLKVSLPSSLRIGGELAKISFSLYAIHYPILLLLNVTVASGRQDFTFASVGLDASFIVACVLAACVFYFMFESRTPTVRDWLKGIMLRTVAGSHSAIGPAAIIDTASAHYALAADRTMTIPSAKAERPLQSFGSSPSPLPADLQGRPASATASVPMVLLNDGHALPRLGFGVWQIASASAPKVVATAIDAGYRLIDTAASYGNEAGVGAALKRVNLPRSELYVATKVRNEDHGYDRTMRAFDASAARLQLDVIDLYLIHWPCPQRAAYVETWRALVELQKQGRVRSIGVSNFLADHLQRIVGETGVIPALNQIELHPAFQQQSLRNIHERYGIETQAWSPLGQGRALDDPRIQAIAERCGCTTSQIVLRWHLENGFIAIPKSARAAGMAENIDLFHFELTSNDHAVIAGLDRTDGRIGPDPAVYGQMRFLHRLTRRFLPA
ncbi:diketogulonate reductase-like aldo/keto reductase/peptidoglycan/LPS O-acetylase OafA/YrhL [Bradyrhizobium sp. S3.3.6]